jgi:hypothetical protein
MISGGGGSAADARAAKHAEIEATIDAIDLGTSGSRDMECSAKVGKKHSQA